jgi:hypothetical protein
MFTISKPDKNSLRSLADLRGLNKSIKQKPFPTPMINDLFMVSRESVENHLYT